jgi:hypothetical protein
MKVSDLRKGQIYRYIASAEDVNVMYTGGSFCPSVGWGYGFRGYNEETGKYDGYFNTLSGQTVENQICELR